MPSPKKGSSPNKGASPKQAKQKKSPENKPGGDAPHEEEEMVAPVPTGIMHRRMRFILESNLNTDVEFVVGPPGIPPHNIKAHKCVLAAESAIFEKIFNECNEFKVQKLKEKETLAQQEREHERELELATKLEAEAKAAAAYSGSPGAKKSPGKGKSPDKKKDSPKKKSPEKKSPEKKDKKSPEKSPKGGKAQKASPKKGEKKPSPKAKDAKPSNGAPGPRINFYKDEIIGDDMIQVRDVHPLGFYRLLRYLYYDEMVFTGVIGTVRTLYAARKYCFYDLARACVNYLENNVCIEHVLKLTKAALDFHEDRLLSICIRLIANDTFEVIKREEFMCISKDLVQLLLQQDVLNCREIELFDRVMAWAEKECLRIGIMVSAMNQRIALGHFNFVLIRFPTILAHEFATHIVESGVLRTDEIIPILQYYITGTKAKLPYSYVTRRRPCLDLGPLDNASVTFSDQTDVTFIGYGNSLRRSSSQKDIMIPVGVLPEIRRLLIKQRQRTGSPPGRFNVTDDEFLEIEENIRHLRYLYSEQKHYDYSKRHLAVMRSHYK